MALPSPLILSWSSE